MGTFQEIPRRIPEGILRGILEKKISLGKSLDLFISRLAPGARSPPFGKFVPSVDLFKD